MLTFDQTKINILSSLNLPLSIGGQSYAKASLQYNNLEAHG